MSVSITWRSLRNVSEPLQYQQCKRRRPAMFELIAFDMVWLCFVHTTHDDWFFEKKIRLDGMLSFVYYFESLGAFSKNGCSDISRIRFRNLIANANAVSRYHLPLASSIPGHIMKQFRLSFLLAIIWLVWNTLGLDSTGSLRDFCVFLERVLVGKSQQGYWKRKLIRLYSDFDRTPLWLFCVPFLF